MAETQDIANRVENIIAERLRVDSDAFDDETPFDGETLDADSLDLVEIAEAIEADIGVHIPDEDLEGLETVGEFVTYVAEHA
ncbi:acyl carrier protein (plasmid) [Haloferax mediterranei ATCC 33500]|uniref:Acyl carrier protein n=1 Tax=Haloferax mediterranei (strain ATCC 33500 / DSM 1411 / JCM 8866 / NBRC 14739 / NCIMB 2177 / R-4) TaxID=523841 RepID=I3RBD3_HALMT|nr:acyl carrier protein [Haloferax mediterranei]AFK21543.1 acyl carrier protein [Haloferax mediterranei ATCC 33500]AHZ24406.1 phosphopantetheine-binding protein [Haloferax mediterranei ATCC 33500]ELZ97147.1 acyl carrier protein [Haloferax mediterranei ATCC 33500]MDX5990110.1 acyl carrier protein [Haloferax mediterranei ATCC 33500]QCQ76805.1 acyl carrier protein [Haloferax mediterranei ATCC 33500]